MSGRRSTRAVSSRASSVAGSDLGQATPRRSTRHNPVPDISPLPALGPLASRGSTSYGSSIAALPADFRRSGQGRDLTETLTDILGTVQENIQAEYGFNQNPPKPPIGKGPQAPLGGEVGSRGRSRRAASNAPSASNAPAASNGHAPSDTPAAGSGRGRGQVPSVTSTPGINNTISYMSESALYGDATFTEDAVTTPPRHGRRATRPPTGDNDQQHVIEPVTDRVSFWVQLNAWFVSMYKLIASSLSKLATSVSGLLSSVAQKFSSKWALLVLFLLLASIASVFKSTSTTDPVFDEDLRPVGFDISQIRQWIPSSLSHPLSYLNDRDISSLQKRMSVVENEIYSMKRRVILNKEALEELKNILPEEMYLSKRNGETELPPNFWKALMQKVPKGFSPSKDISDVISRSEWDDFIAQNEAMIKALQADVSEDSWAKHLKEALRDGGVLISRAGIMDMINKRWEQSQILIKNQVKSELDNVGKLFGEHYKNTHGVTAQEAKDIFTEMYNNLQLNAFAQGQAAESVAYYHLQRPNHFSFGLGAVVDPSVTSPTYAFAKERAWWPKRLILWGVGYGMPVPNPPAEALRKWDEAGDCWCSPAKGNGAGVQLGVLMANDLFPKEVVIEHIPKSATLDSASAPREMELLARIDGFDAQGTVGELSDNLFPDAYESHLGKEWILIGTWCYEMEDAHHVQHFYPQLDLQSLGVSTRQLVVRAKNNQGDSDHTCLYRVRVHGQVADKSKA